MAQGQVLVGLDFQPEAGVPTYDEQRAAGLRGGGMVERLAYLARLNYAHTYINRIRKRSNDPAWIARAAAIERRLLQPLAPPPADTERAEKFRAKDYYVERAILSPDLVGAMRECLFAPQTYNDPYVAGWKWSGSPDQSAHPMLYMDPQRLFSNPEFLAICANQAIIDFCREVLGPAAAITWAWSWISNPTGQNYQNQNWHRDSSEPLNFVRVFVPLDTIATMEDGPTALIPGSSGLREHFEVRRFSDAELSGVQQRMGAGVVMADVGDVYFVNTFCLHRGVAPLRRRGILTLLVSLSPSHRSPTICPMPIARVPDHLRDGIEANRRFFRYLVQ